MVVHVNRFVFFSFSLAASFSLSQLYERFKPGKEVPKNLGRDNDFNCDLIPKFMMATGTLIKVLIHTNVHEYLNLRSVRGSFVYRSGKLCRVPVTPAEAATSPLMGPIQVSSCCNSLSRNIKSRNSSIMSSDMMKKIPKPTETTICKK